MTCPCGLNQEEVKNFNNRTGSDRIALIGGTCQNPLAAGSVDGSTWSSPAFCTRFYKDLKN